MSRSQKSSKDDPSNSLEQLRQQFESGKQQAEELSASQADNKRRQDYLKKAIDNIQKNVTEFEKDGEELGKQYTHAAHQVDHQLHCVAEALGGDVKDIEAALQSVDGEIYQQQQAIGEQEESLTGEKPLVVTAASRTAARAEKQFELLRVKDLKDRLTQVQTLLKEANALGNTSPPDLAASYALLWLARERLTSSWLAADYEAEQVEFSFPENYEQQLVEAYERMLASREAALATEEELAGAKATMDQAVKNLAAARGARKQSAVQAAQQAVQSQPAAMTATID